MSMSLKSRFETEAENCDMDNVRDKILRKLIELIVNIGGYIYGISIDNIPDLEPVKKYKFCSYSGQFKLRSEKFKNIYESSENLIEVRKYILKQKRFFKRIVPRLGEYNPYSIEWRILWSQEKKDKIIIEFEDTSYEIYETEERLFGYGLSHKKRVTMEFISFLKFCVEKLKGENIKFGIFHDDAPLDSISNFDIYAKDREVLPNPISIGEKLLEIYGGEACLELMENEKIADFWSYSVFHNRGKEDRGDFGVWYSINKPLEELEEKDKRKIEVDLDVDLTSDFNVNKVKEKIKKAILLHTKSKERITELEAHNLNETAEKIIKEKWLQHWSKDAIEGLKSMLKSGGPRAVSGIFKFSEMEAKKKSEKINKIVKRRRSR